MANPNYPHGFRPLMVNTAGAPVGVREYAKPASDTVAIFAWDLLQKVAASSVNQGQFIPEPACKSFSTGTPGTTLILGASLNSGVASSATWHSVIDDPSAIFEAQCDGTTAITVAAHAGKNANVTNTASTSTISTVSVMQINSSSIAATSGLDVRLLDLYRVVTNAEGANAVCEVLILKHVYQNVGTAGV